MNKVILFGGTFDPPHVGHLLMATMAFEQTDCQEVWLLPAATPVHKDGVSPYEVRARMVRELVCDSPGLRVCDVEARRGGPSYTIDTVKSLQAEYPNTEFQWLVGADSLHDLPGWHRSEELSKCISFVVAARTDWPYEETLKRVKRDLPNVQVELLQMPILDVSSSFIRSRLERGLLTCGLVPQGVLGVWESYVSATGMAKGENGS